MHQVVTLEGRETKMRETTDVHVDQSGIVGVRHVCNRHNVDVDLVLCVQRTALACQTGNGRKVGPSTFEHVDVRSGPSEPVMLGDYKAAEAVQLSGRSAAQWASQASGQGIPRGFATAREGA